MRVLGGGLQAVSEAGRASGGATAANPPPLAVGAHPTHLDSQVAQQPLLLIVIDALLLQLVLRGPGEWRGSAWATFALQAGLPRAAHALPALARAST